MLPVLSLPMYSIYPIYVYWNITDATLASCRRTRRTSWCHARILFAKSPCNMRLMANSTLVIFRKRFPAINPNCRPLDERCCIWPNIYYGTLTKVQSFYGAVLMWGRRTWRNVSVWSSAHVAGVVVQSSDKTEQNYVSEASAGLYCTTTTFLPGGGNNLTYCLFFLTLKVSALVFSFFYGLTGFTLWCFFLCCCGYFYSCTSSVPQCLPFLFQYIYFLERSAQFTSV